MDYFRCILLNLKCLHRYDWIALLDVDEVIVPRKHNSWAEMMDEVEDQPDIIITSPNVKSPLISYLKILKVGLGA